MYIGLINAKIKTASPNTRYRIHCTNPINVNMAISRWHPKKKNNLLLPVLWDTSATLDTPSHKNRSDPAAAPPRSTHTPPRGHGTARWPFSLPKSGRACPSHGNRLSGLNTILLNKYMNGDDCIGFHKDREAGWAPNTGFATLAFGAARDFQVKNDESKVTTTYLHESGHAIYMPSPMNQHNTHSVPKRKRVISCRISLTFREISDI